MKYYVIHAFCGGGMQGNPAAVCVTEKNLSAEIMQAIAKRINLPETAFICHTAAGFDLRWFTPTFEINLCGHATLAAAFAVLNFLEPAASKVRFNTCSGILTVKHCVDEYELTLPLLTPQEISVTAAITDALGSKPLKAWQERDLYLLLENETAVKNYVPNYAKLQKLTDWLGVVITARGNETDFVSRYFCPELCTEDPVTGSAHCSLAPLWAKALGKTELTARQLSPQGGVLRCLITKNNLLLYGKARLYSQNDLFTR